VGFFVAVVMIPSTATLSPGAVMQAAPDRRSFLLAAGAAAGTLAAGKAFAAQGAVPPAFKISLAQWSLHRAFFAKPPQQDPLKFAEIAKKEYGIAGAEYVNQFYKDKKKDGAYLKDLKKVADDNGVTSVLIMCDGEGKPRRPGRQEAEYRGRQPRPLAGVGAVPRCHSIRVNAASDWKRASRRRRSSPRTACTNSPRRGTSTACS